MVSQMVLMQQQSSTVNKTERLRPANVRKRDQYVKVQEHYRAKRSQCAKSVISSDWEKEVPSLGFWKPLMETAPKADNRRPRPVNECNEAVSLPVTVSKAEKGLRGLKDGVQGSDGVSRDVIRHCYKNALAARMNLWLYCECPPSVFHEAETTLILKSPEASQPGDYRPIYRLNDHRQTIPLNTCVQT